MNDEALVPKPRLDIIKPDLVRLKTIWMLCCSMPMFYLVIAHLIRAHIFDGEQSGFASLPHVQYNYLLWALIGLGMACQLVMLGVRMVYGKKLQAAAGNLSALIRVYSRRTFIMIGLSETTALLGFILFLVNGQFPVVFAFGIASMLLYAQSYPSERGLASVARQA